MIQANRIAAALLVAAALAHAQGMGANAKEEMRKRMEEISRLMRESERLLLEITRVEKMVRQQEEIVRKLKELEQEQPPQAAASAAQERQKRAEELRRRQEQAAEAMDRLFDDQREKGAGAARELEQLLKSWPKSQQQSGGQDGKKPRPKQQPRERDPKKELKNNRPDEPRDKKDLFKKQKKSGAQRPEDKTQDPRRLKQIQAWIARLPPEQLERINRGDLSFVPARYQRLVREYTALRAKRETETDK